jgi:hypothetical protein
MAVAAVVLDIRPAQAVDLVAQVVAVADLLKTDLEVQVADLLGIQAEMETVEPVLGVPMAEPTQAAEPARAHTPQVREAMADLES